MAKRLWEVTEQRVCPRIDFLRKKAQVIRRLCVRHEDTLRLVELTRHRKNLRQPESTKDECSLLTADPIAASIAVHVRTISQLSADPLHGPKDAVVIGRQEAVDRKQEQGRIGMLVIICRDESLSRFV
jgi:hypothetical protein